MPEPSPSSTASTATEPVEGTAPVDDAVTPASEGELRTAVATDAVTVETIDDVELGVTAAPSTAAAEAQPKRKHKLGPFFWLAAGWLVLLVLLAALADFLPFVKDPNEVFRSALARRGGRIVAGSPSPEHWLGGDSGGRDLFARVVYGARVSLIVGVASIAIGLVIGGTLGLVAGYFRGKTDSVITALANILLAFPPLILALALVSFMGQNLRNVITALAILAIPSLIRITRAATLTFSQREFVMAARTLGASHWRVLTREVLPNVVPPMASFALLAVAVVIVAEGTLSFLGLSVESPAVSWGKLIQEGRQQLDETPHVSLLPCLVMFITLLALNYVGDKLRSLFNVRESGLG
ncbi:MAG: ABC transporter permease [Actinomycetota bacterium]|nr:ABC transporter permease [Actinomycetota bacterium]